MSEHINCSTWMLLLLMMALLVSCSRCEAGYTRTDFDKADAAFNGGNGYKTGTGELLAWGESYLMQSYIEMYRATGDACYLDKLVDHAGHVLASRDDNRGFRDYSGRSRAAWSVAGVYTVAELTLKDTAGSDILKIRSTPYAYNNQTTVKVVKASDDKFDLFIENPYWKKSEEYKGLSMDRSSPDFIERHVNSVSWVPKERKIEYGDKGSGLVTVEALGSGLPVTTNQEKAVKLEPLYMAYHGYSGQILFPMLEFTYIVRNTPELAAKYGRAADHYIAEAEKVFKDADEEWRDGPNKGEGYYVFGNRGCPFWADNVPKPFNYLGSEALCLLRLGQLTGNSKWTGKALAIARLFKRHLKLQDNGSYVWNYWWGPITEGWNRDNSPSYNTPTYAGAARAEDTSHGCLEIYFAAQCAEAGLVFDSEDMQRFARTFLLNVVDQKKFTMNTLVDGKGDTGKHDAMVGYWMELAKWEPRVASVALEVAKRQELQDKAYGSPMLSLARSIKWTLK